MKTIIVCTTSYHPFLGGAEVAIQEIAKRLSGEFRFFIVTARQDQKLSRREVRPEGTVLRVGAGTGVDKWALAFFGGFIIAWKLKFGEWKHAYQKKECALFGVDISQGSVAAALASFLLPRVPFILNIQYGYGDMRLKEGRGGLINRAFRRMLARADFVTAISNYCLGVARQYEYRGGAAIVPNGVAVEQFANTEEKKIHERPTIITVSRLVPKNAVDVLICAIAEAQKKIPDIQCHIIGDGPERERLLQQTTDLNLREHISFFGAIPNNDLPSYLRNADVFVRPSRSEGMGISFVEALAAGLPIIGTPIGGIPDIIENGKTGIFTNVNDPDDLADKIVQLLGNKSLRQTIIAEGQKIARERFSWDGIAKRYGKIFAATGFPLKRVVVAAPLYPPDAGGPATYVYTLTEELPQLGIGIAIAYFGEVRRLPKIVRHVGYFLKVFLRARGRDIIFAQDPVSTGLPALVAAKILRKKFVIKIVGDYAWEQWQQNKRQAAGGESEQFIGPEEFQNLKFDWKTETRRKIERYVATRADHVVVPSNYLKKIVLMWGVSNEKFSVISNAFDVRYEAARYQNKVMKQGKMLVTGGRLVPWKGFEAVIRLMPRIRQKFPHSDLKIIGDGPVKTKLQNLVKALHLENAVSIMGSVSHKDFLEILSQGDLFVLNTGYEGMSHILLEAMALGVPIVTTNVCGNPEVIANGAEGILVDYNDGEGMLSAVTAILDNKDLRENMTMRAKAKVRQFSRERMINRTKDLLHNNQSTAISEFRSK